MKLSKRLEAIAAMVPAESIVADIGTDHGYIPIWLVEQGVVKKALAMDIGEGPLLRAKEHIDAHKLEGRIQVRLSDGLEQLKPGEADTVIIAGMGGELMLSIIKKGQKLWNDISRWILSPQSELSAFRHGLEELGFAIVGEEFLEEDGKYYTVLDVVRGSMHYERKIDYRYGFYLLDRRHPVLFRFLEKEEKQLLNIYRQLKDNGSAGSYERMAQLEEEISQVKEAYDEMQGIDRTVGSSGPHGLCL